MNDTASTPEVFLPSAASPLAKVRRYTWMGLGLGVIFILARNGFGGGFWISLIPLLLISGLMHWVFSRQLSPQRGSVTLDANGLSAPNLTGPAKQFAWSELAQVEVETVQGNCTLKFQLHPGSERPDRRSFWNGANPARPTLNLAPFAPPDQERLLSAIRRWKAGADGSVATDQTVANELVAEREFQEQLKALAPQPWVTYALVAINLAIWGFTLLNGGSLLQTPADKLLLWGGNAASEVQKGEWWRLLTATFMHSGLMHVAMNMLGLYTAGVLVERIYGARLYLIVYFGAGLLGSAFSLHFAAQQAVSVGASGAVFGVTGALLVAVLQHRDKLPKSFSKQMISGVGFFVVYSLLQGFAKSGIDNAAHIGGLLGGALAAFILPERFDLPAFRSVMRRRALITLGVMTTATVGIGALAPAAPVDQVRVAASGEKLDRAAKDFDRAMKAIKQDGDAMAAGTLSEREADRRSRTVHAPELRRLTDAFADLTLRPGDPREPLVRDMHRLSQLLSEGMAMDSVFNEATGKLDPINPQRAAEIEAEILKVGRHLQASVEQMKAAKKS